MDRKQRHPVNLKQYRKLCGKRQFAPSRLGLSICVSENGGENSQVGGCCWSGLSSSRSREGWRDSEGVQGSVRMAQSPAFKGNVLCGQ
jgi:hypothetical protein